MTATGNSPQSTYLTVIFDIDGTLADTREATAQAYARAGVRYYDRDFGLRWQDWLPERVGTHTLAEQVHSAKTQHYVQILQETGARELPAAHLARRLSETPAVRIGFATGASVASASAILRCLGLDLTAHPHVTGASAEEKAAFVAQYSTSTNRAVYLDCDPVIGRAVAGMAGVPYLNGSSSTAATLEAELWMR